jgi:hypothetical protein
VVDLAARRTLARARAGAVDPDVDDSVPPPRRSRGMTHGWLPVAKPDLFVVPEGPFEAGFAYGLGPFRPDAAADPSWAAMSERDWNSGVALGWNARRRLVRLHRRLSERARDVFSDVAAARGEGGLRMGRKTFAVRRLVAAGVVRVDESDGGVRVSFTQEGQALRFALHGD